MMSNTWFLMRVSSTETAMTSYINASGLSAAAPVADLLGECTSLILLMRSSTIFLVIRPKLIVCPDPK